MFYFYFHMLIKVIISVGMDINFQSLKTVSTEKKNNGDVIPYA